MPSKDGCQQFVASRYNATLRAAYLLTGSRSDAQDLTHEALIRVIQHWRQVAAADDSPAYASRILLNVFLSGRRRRWHREDPTSNMPETPYEADYAGVVERDRLRRALAALPPRQRAAVVLRHYEQLSEQDAATAMGCSVGTVKSLTSRGLASLRDVLNLPTVEEVSP